MESEIDACRGSLPTGWAAELDSLTPAGAEARAIAASAHPSCPSQGVLALLLGHALAKGVLLKSGGASMGEEAGPAAGQGRAARQAARSIVTRRRAAAEEEHRSFLCVLHRWWVGAGWGCGADSLSWEAARPAGMRAWPL
jgi:hypothetical protein